MVGRFVIGEFYYIPKAPDNTKEAPGWPSSGHFYIGVRLQCEYIEKESGFGSLSIQDPTARATGCWLMNPKWAELYYNMNVVKVENSEPCQCIINAFSGCICGFFNEEMESKGLKKDLVTGLWMKEA